jgi:ankyrin repeat protein
LILFLNFLSFFSFLLDILELLLANGGNVHIVDGDNRSLLHIACDNGDLSLVKYLVEKGVSLKNKDKNGWTPLHIACGPADDYELAHYLIQNGADPYARDMNQYTPLHLATQFKAKKVGRYLKILQDLDSDIGNDDSCSDLDMTNDTYESDNVFESEPTSNRVSQKSNISIRMVELSSNKSQIVQL